MMIDTDQENGDFQDDICLEEILLGNEIVEIPSDLFENEEIFNQFFSSETWNELLPEDVKLSLLKFLPTFDENDLEEKTKTIDMLFGKEKFHFSNPLNLFREKLLRKEFSPESVEMNIMVKSAHRRNYSEWLDNYQFEIAQKCLNSRKKYLELATGNIVTVPKIERKRGAKGGNMSEKIQKRFRDELLRIKHELGDEGVSSDEEEQDLTPPRPRKVVVEPFTDENDAFSAEPIMEDVSLTQDIQPCFFSLLRDLFHQSPACSLSQSEVESGVAAWQNSPIAPLNPWFAAAGEGWVNNVDSSLTFLCCQSLVSRDHGSGDYHWTGGEHDAELVDLCSGWVETREQYSGALVSPVNGAMQTTTDPGPGNVTTWTVRPSTQQERQCYRDQESKRYAAAEEAWQWQCHDYTALVAPVRTMTQASVRPHPMLLQDRPVPVSLLTLVRDAVSRLPNGEGTRADIVELLRDSQWLVPDVETTALTTVVSGALDRLQNDADGPVRYDNNRKIWIYLHRDKSLQQLNSMPADGAKQQRQRQKRKFKVDTSLPKPSNDDQSASVQKIIVKDADGNVIPLSQETLQRLISSGALKATT